MKDALGDIQSVLVLGGTSEIALATVRKLVARRCTTVVLAVRDPASVSQVLDELRAAGVARAEAVAFDAVATDTHEQVIGDAFSRFGDFDAVLLAFGVLGDQAAFDAEPATAAAAIAVNYTGAVTSGLVVADHLRRQGHGTLVFLSSVAGERVRRDNFVYGSTKAGLDGFAQGLADALAGTGASVLIVRPGFVHTKMTAGMKAAPLSTTPEAVADVIVAGIARGRTVVWAPPLLRVLMSVLRHLPRSVWRRVSALQSR